MEYKTEQEAFWAGEFGQEYMGRNRGSQLLARKVALFGQMLRAASRVRSICEFGCNIGLNLRALAQIHDFELAGIEINAQAAGEARSYGVANIREGSLLDEFTDVGLFDLTFTMGVLIHISPDHLATAYDNLVRLSRRYILVAEYYNPDPVSIEYRGHQDRLFKRDFAGDLMDRHDLELVDYGFIYHRDNHMPMGDCTWFLLQKPSAE